MSDTTQALLRIAVPLAFIGAAVLVRRWSRAEHRREAAYGPRRPARLSEEMEWGMARYHQRQAETYARRLGRAA